MPHSFIHWPLTLSATLSAGVLIGASLFGSSTGRDDVARNVTRIQEVISYIRHDYVDTVNTDKLGQSAIVGMLERLDPHSSYVPSEELDMANAQLEDNFEGIGIEFILLHDTIQVVTPINGGPSEKAGIYAGDRIISVNGDAVAGMHITNAEVFNKLRGAHGSVVDLVLVRPGLPKTVRVSLKRDRIPTRSVEASLIMEAHTGYIKISRFTSGTDKEFTLALRELKRQNIARLVLDLRDNPGGYLDKAIKVADEFIPAGRTISYTEGKASKYNSTYTSTKNGMFETGGLVVLINEGSASASEILAGALQDNDRATIVGRRSFGKGLVQMPISLRDGSELRLTISRYHTPSGRCIQKPYDSKDLGLYEEDLDSRFAQGELFVEDSIHLSDTVRYKTIGGRIVYGGGGIKPDVFVPLDTTRNNIVISQMHNAYVFVGISQNYAHQYGKMIRSKGLAYYKHQFFPTTALEVEMLDRSRKEGIGLSDRRWQKVKSAAGIELKAAIARKIYGEKCFYRVLLDADADYQRAVQSFPKALVQK